MKSGKAWLVLTTALCMAFGVFPVAMAYSATNDGVMKPFEISDTHSKIQLWENGPYWADTNIGAEKPWECGYCFWWGDTVGYSRENASWLASDGSCSNFSFIDAPTYDQSDTSLKREGWITEEGVLAPDHDAAQMQWGGKWRIPTYQELRDLCDECDWTWTTNNGMRGYIVHGRGNYANASIFLPAAGQGEGPNYIETGRSGYYWSSVPGSDSCEAIHLAFHIWSSNPDIWISDPDLYVDNTEGWRDLGFSIRPVQEFTTAGAIEGTAIVDGIKWTYIVFNGETTVGGGDEKSAIPHSTTGDITIPTTLGGYPVTRVGSDAFYNCSGLTTMIIPSGVSDIGTNVFTGCNELATLYVPPSWEGTDMLSNASVPAGCDIIYGYPLRLEPEGGWAVTSPDATVTFTVSCDLPPGTDLPLDISAATPEGASAFDVILPATGSVAIPAGATSTTFRVALKTTGLGNSVDIAASGPGGGDWIPATYNLKGPYGEGSFRWSKSVHHNGTKTDDWDLEPGDTVEFWINNDADEFQACNPYITAGTAGEGLSCSELAPWGEAGEGGSYTSGLLTAVDAGEHAHVPFRIKYGDAVIFEYGFHVWGAAGGEDVKIPAETMSFDGASFGFAVPEGYGISKVEYASEVVDGEWKFDHETTFVVENSEVTVDLPNVPGAVFRVTFAK